MTKTITATQLATQMRQIKKWLEYGYELTVINKNTNQPFAILKPFEEVNKEKKSEVIDLTNAYEGNSIELSEVEKENIYEVFNQDPKQSSIKPVARYRN